MISKNGQENMLLKVDIAATTMIEPSENQNQESFVRKDNSMPVVDELREFWLNKLFTSCPQASDLTREAIIDWLLWNNMQLFENLSSKELEIITGSMEYRWKILNQRYLGISPEKAYRNLIVRLGSLVTLRNKAQTWISLSRDRQRQVLDILSELIQELLQRDKYIQEQMSYTATLTKDTRLRNAMLLASIEEYCLRPIQNQPLIAHRFVTYARRLERNGLTQVPNSNIIRFVSDEMGNIDNDDYLSLFDSEAIIQYQAQLEQQEQKSLRQEIQEKFEEYLKATLGEEAVQWLHLYLQGQTPDAIAKKLNKPVQKIYRLRETVKYHAVLIFKRKEEWELVQAWLKFL